MSYRLRMSAEIGDWLAEVTAAESVAATELGAALVVLTQANELPGPPLVTDLSADLAAPSSGGDDPRYAVDHAYQEILEALGEVRRQAAMAGGPLQRVGVRTFDDGRPPEQFDEPLPEAEQAARAKREQELIARSQRMQSAVDAFRTAKETAKAMYTAAEASLSVHAAIVAAESSGVFASDDGGSAADAESAGRDEEATEAELNEALGAAEASLAATLAQAKRTLREIRRESRLEPGQRETEDATERAATEASDDEPVPGLLELRADPLGTDLRILFAVAAADTLTLLAVLDGTDAIDDHRDEAIRLAGEALTEIRDGSWPSAEPDGTEAGEVCFDDAATFLTKLFPDRGTAILARAAELADLGTLAGLRRERELSIADIAVRAGLAEHRVWEIEYAGLRSAELHEAAAYLRALGGRLDLTATFGSGERTSLS